MKCITVAFGGLTVTISFETPEAQDHLSLLFKDVSTEQRGEPDHSHLSLLFDENSKKYHLLDGTKPLYHGPLGVKLAAYLYDAVIFHLLNKAETGIGLHAGAITCNAKTILLPGQSGAGKSTLIAWLISRQFCYLTDELIFLSMDTPGDVEYFRRPLCLKAGSSELIKDLLSPEDKEEILADSDGAVIPHRLLNPVSEPSPQSPSLVVLPEYSPEAGPELEPISKARLATLLMGCHANARNLADHGFKKIIDIAGSTTAYRLRYDRLEAAEDLLKRLVHG